MWLNEKCLSVLEMFSSIMYSFHEERFHNLKVAAPFLVWFFFGIQENLQPTVLGLT